MGKGDVRWYATSTATRSSHVRGDHEPAARDPGRTRRADSALRASARRHPRRRPSAAPCARSPPSSRTRLSRAAAARAVGAAQSDPPRPRRRVVHAPQRPDSLRFAPGSSPTRARRGRGEPLFTASTAARSAVPDPVAHRRIQYQFVGGPRTPGSSRPRPLHRDHAVGVRAIDVHAARSCASRASEYCYVDETTQPPTLHSQIRKASPESRASSTPSRLDASAWIGACR